MKIQHKSPDKGRRVNQVRRQTLAAGFAWQGNTFDIDPNSLGLIAGRALRLTLDPNLAEVVWRSQANQNITFTRDDFLAFAQAVDAHVESIYQQSWEQKDATTG